MRKNLPKIFIIFFLAIFILQIAALFLLLFNPAIARAAADIDFTPQVTIGDFESGESTKVTSNTIGNYITAIYNYGIGIVGIVSAVVMMFGGFLWLVAGGDSGKVSEAKEWIKSALVGLILVLLSYTILLTINPDLVEFQPLNITTIKELASQDKNSSNQDSLFYGSDENIKNQAASQTAFYKLAQSGAFNDQSETPKYLGYLNSQGMNSVEWEKLESITLPSPYNTELLIDKEKNLVFEYIPASKLPNPEPFSNVNGQIQNDIMSMFNIPSISSLQRNFGVITVFEVPKSFLQSAQSVEININNIP